MASSPSLYGDDIHDHSDGLARLHWEESGDMAYAKQCAASILKWLRMDLKSAREYVLNFPDPYMAGSEEVVLPASRALCDKRQGDGIFPPFLETKENRRKF
jgi:hypothetical protein